RFAHMLEHDKHVKWFGHVLHARTSFMLLTACGAGLLLCLLIAAVATHVTDRLSIRLRRRYQEYCTFAAVSRLASRFHMVPTSDGRSVDIGDVMRIARGDAMLNGRSAAMLVSGIMPAVTALLAVGTMFILNTTASVVIVALVLASGYFLYRANVAAA